MKKQSTVTVQPMEIRSLLCQYAADHGLNITPEKWTFKQTGQEFQASATWPTENLLPIPEPAK